MGIIIFFGILAAIVVLPSYVVQSIWNSLYSFNLERDMTIELWQAACLWIACLSAIYMTGIFKFKVDFKTIDSIDLDSIKDPDLKAEIEKLKAKAKEEDKEDKN